MEHKQSSELSERVLLEQPGANESGQIFSRKCHNLRYSSGLFESTDLFHA